MLQLKADSFSIGLWFISKQIFYPSVYYTAYSWLWLPERQCIFQKQNN